jgi:hypothetical protein
MAQRVSEMVAKLDAVLDLCGLTDSIVKQNLTNSSIVDAFLTVVAIFDDALLTPAGNTGGMAVYW